MSREVYFDVEWSEDGAIIYALPTLNDIWLDEGKECCQKRLEVAKEHAHARDHWKFEAEQASVPILSLQMSMSLSLHYNIRLVQWYLMMSLPALLSPLMMIRLSLLL